MTNLKPIGILSIIFVFVGFVSCGTFPIEGNGNLISTEKTVSQFEKINGSGTAEVIFHMSQEYRVVVTVDSNLDEYLEIYTRNNVLNIGTKNGSYSFTKYLVDVYCPTLTGVSISGSGSFTGNDKIIASSFESKVSGSGNITITGTGNDSNISISGSGKFNGIEFKTNNADARISGSGNMDIWVLEYINANISGSGSIKYRGTPRIDFNGSGSGSIKAE
jgi:hypothetical protein